MYAVAVGTVGILVALFLFFPPGTAVVTALSIFAIEVMTVPFVVLGGIRIGAPQRPPRFACPGVPRALCPS